MSYPYLDQLPLSDDERAKLAALAASTPAALLAMIKAAPQAFHQFLGKRKTQDLVVSLEDMLDAQQRAMLSGPTQSRLATGAIVGRRAPALKKPAYSLVERDRLYAELQELRRQPEASPQTRQRIQQLESTLNAMLETA